MVLSTVADFCTSTRMRRRASAAPPAGTRTSAAIDVEPRGDALHSQTSVGGVQRRASGVREHALHGAAELQLILDGAPLQQRSPQRSASHRRRD